MASDPPLRLTGFRVRVPDWQIVDSVTDALPAVPRPAVGDELDSAIELTLRTEVGRSRGAWLGPEAATRVARALNVAAQRSPIAVDPVGVDLPLGALLRTSGRQELLCEGCWVVDRVADGIRLADCDDEGCEVSILGTAEALALGEALARAAAHVAAHPPRALPDHLVAEIGAPYEMSVEVLQGVRELDSPRVQLLVSSHTWCFLDPEARALGDALAAAAAAPAPGTWLSWSSKDTFDGDRPWCTVTTEDGAGVVLVLCDEINEEGGDDGRYVLSAEAAARLSEGLQRALAFTAAHPPHVYEGSPLHHTDIADGGWRTLDGFEAAGVIHTVDTKA